MKKAIAFAAAALLLAGCGKEIEQHDKAKVTLPDEVTAAEDLTLTDDTPTPAEDKPAVTEAPKKEETSKAETTAKKKKADPDEIDLACMTNVEVYQKIKLSEFIIDSNAKLKNGDDILDTEDLGEHEVTLELELDGGEAEKKVKYNVVDTTPPVLLLGDDISVAVGDWFDINSYISYADNYDRAPILEVYGDADTSSAGTYPVDIAITDRSGNTLTKTLNVNVSDNAYDVYYDDSSIYFSDFVSRYAGEGREFGIDVSRWQGDIDFGAVAAEGCSFAIIRMGYGEFGGADLDACYYDNMSGAVNAGLDVGVYFYSTDTTEEGARATARRIVEELGGQQLEFPVAFDWEEFQCFQNYGMNIHDLSQVYEAFSDELEKNGYESMLYSSKNFLELFWENRNDRPVWLAHYVEDTTYEGEWLLWQRCGTGRISGINGAVDLNVLQRK
ncbi:GH25 family lysozyme [Ruminococcus sp.]|uniref:GH25 family lysozyme n=1 Tax=Ruminococcus sp. TaxID=41978 RepID=UPI0025DEDACF|nr:GH25 family lysozyme [Ruminococcus sp.]MBQ8965111.1 glycoside hydrolase [Ruminococcus sp.]